jgi:glycosyltransferase involved in cell wall biosynthesis
MRVLFSVIHFDLLTGASMQVYELGRALTRRGHQAVVVAPDIGGDLTHNATAQGMEVHRLDRVPESLRPDVLHLNQAEPSARVLTHFSSTPAVATIHSSGRLDQPIAPERVAVYACVRPEIQQAIVRAYGIPRQRTTVICNGIDLERFNHEASQPPPRARKLVLFAGTLGSLRRPAVLDLIDRGRRDGFDVRLVGLPVGDFPQEFPPHVSLHRGEVWEIEKEVKNADQVAGIFLGRTTVEGWACDKPAWIYDVGTSGQVLGLGLHPPPHASLMKLFDIERVADAYERLYAAAMGS